MKKIDIAHANAPLSKYARELNHEPLVVTDGDQTIAALMPIDESDLESLALGTNPKFQALIEAARAQRQAGSGLSTEEVRRELGIDS